MPKNNEMEITVNNSNLDFTSAHETGKRKKSLKNFCEKEKSLLPLQRSTPKEQDLKVTSMRAIIVALLKHCICKNTGYRIPLTERSCSCYISVVSLARTGGDSLSYIHKV